MHELRLICMACIKFCTVGDVIKELSRSERFHGGGWGEEVLPRRPFPLIVARTFRSNGIYGD